MKNEEAQKMLTEIRHYLTAGNPVWDVDKVGEAMTMAIEALKDVQNCVHCEHYTEVETDTGIQGECKMDTAHREDLISREEVLRMIIVAGECEPDLGYTHLHTVIKSLPSIKPTGDLISRHGVSAWLSNMGHDNLADMVMDEKRFPSAEPKTGEWIEHTWAEEYDGLLISNYECTNCHSWERDNTDFCPNCGAVMNGGEEE